MIVPEDASIRNSKSFFQIDAGVGVGRPNNRDDVAIVQFMLGTLQTIYFGGETVRMDGVAGRNTNAAILAFQQFMKIPFPGLPKSPALATDSAVDPCKAPISGHRPNSTLGLLNLMTAKHVFKWPDITGESVYQSGGVKLSQIFG
jgi:peptidoglycan hydrolase-like protein with peptidoglycan-binding domain